MENQSGALDPTASASQYKMQETVTFHDQSQSWITRKPDLIDPTRAMTDTSNVTLSQFLARPVLIKTINWATTSPVLVDNFNPWKLFFEHIPILRKISNYANLQCKLHLKFVINGNAFHYGRAVASYTPLPQFTSYPLLIPLFDSELTRYTSRPFVLLDPNTNQGAEMVLPFFWFLNTMSIVTSEWDLMGEIDVTSMNVLKHATGASDSVRINVYAWAEDVVLSTPTSKIAEVLVNSSDQSSSGLQLDNQVGDEYTGVVSAPASTAAKIAGIMSNMPVIGPFARASQMAASTVANVASLFGYSRPVATDLQSMRVQFAGNYANTNVVDNSFKLSTDVKQETTVDPRTVGLGDEDEMVIANIAQRQAFWFKFPWTVDSFTNTRLASIAVTPCAYTIYQASKHVFTPCCFAALPFANWRGTMRYRFQVVASSFHKGRLLIRYDPYENASADISVGFSRIVDISEERDFTIDVGWGVHHNYCKTINPGTFELPYRASNVIMTGATWNSHANGILSVYVMNDLTVPNSEVDNDIEVNVYVSAGDDIEFQNPQQGILDGFVFHNNTPTMDAEEVKDHPRLLKFEEEYFGTQLDNQSGVVAITSELDQNTTLPSQPMQAESIGGMAKTSTTNQIADVCFGERIVSFRSLLKRYNLHEIMVWTAVSSPTPVVGELIHYQRRSKAFPLPRGYSGLGIHVTGTGLTYNYMHNTLLNYLSVGYAGWRGGLRLKITPADRVSSNAAPVTQTVHSITRMPFPGVEANVQHAEGLAATNNSRAASAIINYPTGHAGTIFQEAVSQPTLEAEIPYATPFRFSPAQRDSGGAANYSTGFQYDLTTMRRSAISGYRALKYVAAADDFSLFFYIGPPPAYYAPSDPSPPT